MRPPKVGYDISWVPQQTTLCRFSFSRFSVIFARYGTTPYDTTRHIRSSAIRVTTTQSCDCLNSPNMAVGVSATNMYRSVSPLPHFRQYSQSQLPERPRHWVGDVQPYTWCQVRHWTRLAPGSSRVLDFKVTAEVGMLHRLETCRNGSLRSDAAIRGVVDFMKNSGSQVCQMT